MSGMCVWFQSVAADIYVLDGSFIIIRPEFVYSLLMLIHLYSLRDVDPHWTTSEADIFTYFSLFTLFDCQGLHSK